MAARVSSEEKGIFEIVSGRGERKEEERDEERE